MKIKCYQLFPTFLPTAFLTAIFPNLTLIVLTLAFWSEMQWAKRTSPIQLNKNKQEMIKLKNNIQYIEVKILKRVTVREYY